MPTDTYDLRALEAFYRWNAAIYDFTRPFILFGRGEAVKRLDASHEDLVLDVGCGTGFSLPPLLDRGARVVGIDASSAMLARARRRIERRAVPGHLELDQEPYGSHGRYEGRATRVLFSYSLSMIPPFEAVIERAHRDLSPGGRIVVIDFLQAWPTPFREWLESCHVLLGSERLRALQGAFPQGKTTIHSGLLWSTFLFEAVKE